VDVLSGLSRGRWVRRAIAAVVALLLAVAVAITVLYAWPLGGDRFENGRPRAIDFAGAAAEAVEMAQKDGADPQVTKECASSVLSHGAKTAKAVLMLHGYTDCPAQYSGLAKHFFDLGYNVYVPRAPRHGVLDRTAHHGLRADELVTYADEALNVVAGLGDEVGVIGISGGGVLATWLAEFRPDVVQHLLVLSPFYRPASSQAPGFAVQPLIVLFGSRVLPDRVQSNGFSFAALSQYLRIAANFREVPENPRLTSVAVVVSPLDPFIDRDLAFRIPETLAGVNDATLVQDELPAELGLKHDLVAPDDVGPNAAELYTRYSTIYEGGQPPKL